MPHLIAISSINNHFSEAIFQKVKVVCITRLMADEPQRAIIGYQSHLLAVPGIILQRCHASCGHHH